MKHTRLFALVAVLALGACACPPGLGENLANVEAITEENTAALAGSTEPESLKTAKSLRNREALEVARKLVEACR